MYGCRAACAAIDRLIGQHTNDVTLALQLSSAPIATAAKIKCITHQSRPVGADIICPLRRATALKS